jgi:hypothetical protein
MYYIEFALNFFNKVLYEEEYNYGISSFGMGKCLKLFHDLKIVLGIIYYRDFVGIKQIK